MALVCVKEIPFGVSACRPFWSLFLFAETRMKQWRQMSQTRLTMFEPQVEAIVTILVPDYTGSNRAFSSSFSLS